MVYYLTLPFRFYVVKLHINKEIDWIQSFQNVHITNNNFTYLQSTYPQELSGLGSSLVL